VQGLSSHVLYDGYLFGMVYAADIACTALLNQQATNIRHSADFGTLLSDKLIKYSTDGCRTWKLDRFSYACVLVSIRVFLAHAGQRQHDALCRRQVTALWMIPNKKTIQTILS
jgi:hypothetical protein